MFRICDVNMLFGQNLDIKKILYKYTNELGINLVSKENHNTKDMYRVWPGCVVCIFHVQFSSCLAWKVQEKEAGSVFINLSTTKALRTSGMIFH